MAVTTPPAPPALLNSGARTAIILGSGLNSFVDALSVDEIIPYPDIPGHPTSSVPGHSGQYSVGTLGGTPLIVAQGRVHLYEGWTATEVATGVRLLAASGIERVILTNAAGTLHPNHPPGTWMMLTDHLNLLGDSPLTGGPHFVDLSETYDRDLRATFRSRADELSLTLHEGVYASLRGPQYETPAEIRMLRTLGADAVGMSTVPEAIQARALGVKVTGFSCLTNWAAGMTPAHLDHSEVTETGRAAADTLIRLLRATLPGLE
ncbi:MAG: purine-nucleoside phosphorylase [Chthoniobacterales bacterium]